jgi:hypothetical protein
MKIYRDRLQFDDTTGSALLHINRLCDDRENGINYIYILTIIFYCTKKGFMG